MRRRRRLYQGGGGRPLPRREPPPPGWHRRVARAVPPAWTLAPHGRRWRYPTPVLPTPRAAGDRWDCRFPAAAGVAAKTMGCACGGGCGGSSAPRAWRWRSAAAGILGGGHDGRGHRVQGWKKWSPPLLVYGGSDRLPRPQLAVGGQRCAQGGRRRCYDHLRCDGRASAPVRDAQRGRLGWRERRRRNAAAATGAAVTAVGRDAIPDDGVPKWAVSSPRSRRRRLVAAAARGTSGQILDPPRRWG